jgi:hypothetical protein
MEQEWSRDIYLMHHYTLSTSVSFCPEDESIKYLWQTYLPTIAVDHPFLMQGLLALSALHLSQLRPDERSFRTTALRHQALALSLFRSTIPGLDQSNSDAMFGLAIILSITSVASSKWSPPLMQGGVAPLSDIIEPLLLTRGVVNILSHSSHWIAQGPMKPFLDLAPMNTPQAPLSSATVAQFAKLHAVIADVFLADSPTWKIFDEALVALKASYSEIVARHGQPSRNPGMAWKWPVMISQEFFSHLNHHDPLALIIFGHFAILSRGSLGPEWYLNEWADRAFASAKECLPMEWREYMIWPQEQLVDRLQAVIAGESADVVDSK